MSSASAVEHGLLYGHRHGRPSSVRTATTLSSVVNLSNTILGSGMLVMSSAIASIGLAAGMTTILFSACAAGLGLYFLAQSALAIYPVSASYFSVCQRTYPSSAVLFDLAIAIKCFGVGVSYLIVVGDLMPQIMADSQDFLPAAVSQLPSLADRRIWVTVAVIIVAPLTFLQRLDSLRHTSMVALTAVAYLLIIVVYHYFVSSDFVPAPRDQIDLGIRLPLTWHMVARLPIFVFAFTCHQNLFTVCNELQDPTPRRLRNVIFRAVGVSGLCYQIIGVLGYLSFGRGISPDLILMYGRSHIVTIGRAFLVVLFIFSFPLQAHPCRASMLNVVSYLRSTQWKPLSHLFPDASERPMLDKSDDEEEGEGDGDDEAHIETVHAESSNHAPLRARRSFSEVSVATSHSGSVGSRDGTIEEDIPTTVDGHGVATHIPTRLYIVLSVSILVGSYIVTMMVDTLDVVLAWVGSTGSTTISFILPGAFYYKLHQRSPWTLRKALAAALFCYGLTVMFVCIIVNLSHLGSGRQLL